MFGNVIPFTGELHHGQLIDMIGSSYRDYINFCLVCLVPNTDPRMRTLEKWSSVFGLQWQLFVVIQEQRYYVNVFEFERELGCIGVRVNDKTKKWYQISEFNPSILWESSFLHSIRLVLNHTVIIGIKHDYSL